MDKPLLCTGVASYLHHLAVDAQIVLNIGWLDVVSAFCFVRVLLAVRMLRLLRSRAFDLGCAHSYRQLVGFPVCGKLYSPLTLDSYWDFSELIENLLGITQFVAKSQIRRESRTIPQ